MPDFKRIGKDYYQKEEETLQEATFHDATRE